MGWKLADVKHKIFLLAVALMLVFSLFGAALPVATADPGELSWSAETIPSTVNNVLTPDEHISDLAAVGETVYAAMGAAKKVYKSTNTGDNWTELSAAKATTSFPNLPFNLVAVAPDDASVVAVVTGINTVEYSTNGGSSWTDLHTPATGVTIRCIDISKERAGYRYLAVGGDDGTGGRVWTLRLAVGEVWRQRADIAKGGLPPIKHG